MFNKCGARLGWFDRAADTPNKHSPNFGFEGMDSLRRRRRCHIKTARGFGDRAVIDRNEEGFDVKSIH